ncbi:hypothetical protein I302_108756 [Kwoniella bestiolae CBS 10118]|uniref:Protein CPL1-like domain-containing protein n=1 Tax=Kwoniella bestiolae CBS 10118 TaxID=1296100 RepID=A0AAJ8KGC6_9TREE
MIYFHPADATASGLSRRENRGLGGQGPVHAGSFWCPNGMTACQLEQNPASYECIDTESDLESCGGCLYGDYDPRGRTNTTSSVGTDCSTIEGVLMGHSSCVRGDCQSDCMEGFKNEGDRCVQA